MYVLNMIFFFVTEDPTNTDTFFVESSRSTGCEIIFPGKPVSSLHRKADEAIYMSWVFC